MIETILVPIDFSDVTDTVLSVASRFAKAFDARVLLTHVARVKENVIGFELYPEYLSKSIDKQLAQEDGLLHEYEKKLKAEGLNVTTILEPGPRDHQIVDEVESLKPDLVVIGSHGHGALHHLFTKSVCENMLKHATCPVVMVPMKTSPAW